MPECQATMVGSWYVGISIGANNIVFVLGITQEDVEVDYTPPWSVHTLYIIKTIHYTIQQFAYYIHIIIYYKA